MEAEKAQVIRESEKGVEGIKADASLISFGNGYIKRLLKTIIPNFTL